MWKKVSIKSSCCYFKMFFFCKFTENIDSLRRDKLRISHISNSSIMFDHFGAKLRRRPATTALFSALQFCKKKCFSKKMTAFFLKNYSFVIKFFSNISQFRKNTDFFAENLNEVENILGEIIIWYAIVLSANLGWKYQEKQ